jgi:hypothetical protein
MLISTGGDNGTVSCDTFCNNLNNNWGNDSSSCLATRLNIGQVPNPSPALQGKYIPCSVAATAAMSSWNPSVDNVTCTCITFP